MTLYKLTAADGRTKNNTQWGENVTHTATGDIAQALCSNAWIHAYESPEIAVLMNPLHAAFDPFQLWQAEGNPEIYDGQIKCGCRSLTTIRRVPIPAFDSQQVKRFAVHCAAQVCDDGGWRAWAHSWLSGKRNQSFSMVKSYRIHSARSAAWCAMKAVDEIRPQFEAANAASFAHYCVGADIFAAIEFAKGTSTELPKVVAGMQG